MLLTVCVFSGYVDHAKVAKRHEDFNKRFIVSAQTREGFVELLCIQLTQWRHHGHGHILHVTGQVAFQLVNQFLKNPKIKTVKN